MAKVLLAGLLGGLVAFAWGAVSHMMLDLGGMGIQKLPREAAVMATISEEISEPGLFLFPGIEPGVHLAEEEQAEFEARYRKGPTGFLVYHPTGTDAMSAKRFGTQLAIDIAAALIAAVLLSMMTRVGYLRRVLFVTLLGAFSWVSTDLPMWNWYRFPDDYLIGRMLDSLACWFAAGVVIAGVVSGKPK
ncbi:MAG: hypothetical protein ACI8QZ_002952 [Chlamydiales bacterium]|jgi:hypothetical protein